MKPCICPEDLARFEAGFDADRAAVEPWDPMDSLAK